MIERHWEIHFTKYLWIDNLQDVKGIFVSEIWQWFSIIFLWFLEETSEGYASSINCPYAHGHGHRGNEWDWHNRDCCYHSEIGQPWSGLRARFMGRTNAPLNIWWLRCSLSVSPPWTCPRPSGPRICLWSGMELCFWGLSYNGGYDCISVGISSTLQHYGISVSSHNVFPRLSVVRSELHSRQYGSSVNLYLKYYLDGWNVPLHQQGSVWVDSSSRSQTNASVLPGY